MQSIPCKFKNILRTFSASDIAINRSASALKLDVLKNKNRVYNKIFLLPSYDLLGPKTNNGYAALSTKSLMYHVSRITSGRLKDNLAPGENNLKTQNNKRKILK